MTPVDVQIPMWPMMGNSHLPRQQGNRQAETLAPRLHRARSVLPARPCDQLRGVGQTGTVHVLQVTKAGEPKAAKDR